MTEDELQAASDQMTAAIQAAVDECREVMLRHAETMTTTGAKIGVVSIATCHLMAAMVTAALNPMASKAIVTSTLDSIDSIVGPLVQELYEKGLAYDS